VSAGVREHYETLLAPIYLWMAGGLEHALALGASDVAELAGSGGLAVDLGAGFGMHAIPLARAGWRVIAIDGSAHLIDELRAAARGLDVVAVVGDLRSFAERLPEGAKADLVLCMGDTVTHLETQDDVAALARCVAGTLAPRGRFVATFRDYSTLPSGDARFIPVRSDARRIHTCFLEAEPERVVVHDLLHERGDDGVWSLRVSHYRKLRLAPAAVRETFAATGLEASLSPGPRGMVKLVAHA